MPPFPKSAAAALVALACASCAAEPPAPVVLAAAPAVPALPGEARRRCPPPVALPDRDLSDREVTAGWGADRAALVSCEARRAAAVAAVDAAGSP